jgi:hypothetical protein
MLAWNIDPNFPYHANLLTVGTTIEGLSFIFTYRNLPSMLKMLVDVQMDVMV